MPNVLVQNAPTITKDYYRYFIRDYYQSFLMCQKVTTYNRIDGKMEKKKIKLYIKYI